MRFHRIGEDPRVALRNEAALTPDEVAAITRRLDRLDRASSHGPWTREALDLIEQHPARRAPDLAEMVGRETQPFKTDIRKLKAMGLTESLRSATGCRRGASPTGSPPIGGSSTSRQAFRRLRAAMRAMAPSHPASNGLPGSSRSTTSGAWSDGVGGPLRASRSISAHTTRSATGGVT